MKNFLLSKPILLGATIGAMVMVAGCNKPAEKTEAAAVSEVTLTTDEQKVTYIVGFRMASQAKNGGFTLEKDVMSMAIQDVLDDKEPRISQEDQQTIMRDFQTKQEAQRQEKRNAEAQANKAAGEAYLAENAKKDGVKTTESGLQYEVIVAKDEGASPVDGDKVKVHYHGTLIDGNVFDSSKDRGQPVTFPVTGVIPGWIEALQLMKVGEQYKLTIPANLAYGENGTGSIGPNAVLVFDVELIEINPEPVKAEHSHGDGKPHGHP